MSDSITTFLTPGSLFLLLNIVILTIYLFSRLTFSTRPHYLQPEPEYPAPFLARPPSFLHRLKSFDFSSRVRSMILQSCRVSTRIRFSGSRHLWSGSSLLTLIRINSINPAPDPDFWSESRFEAGTTRGPGLVNRSRSDGVVIKRKMEKSGSENLRDREDKEEVEMRRPESARFERTSSIGGSSDVDAEADNFISKFRQQLMMHRMESLRRCKDMFKGRVN